MSDLQPGAAERTPVPEGINEAGVTAWFAEHVPGVAPPLTFHLIAGGRSNPTFRVVDGAGRAFALRRPPLTTCSRRPTT